MNKLNKKFESRRAQAIYLRKICGLTYRETARIMGISAKGVWMHVTSNTSLINVKA